MKYISFLIYFLSNKILPETFSRDRFMLSIKNIQWVGLSKIISMLISLITTSIIARVFGPEKFGILNYVLSFVGLFSILASLGVSAVVYKELVVNKEKREEVLGSAMALNFIAGIITIGIICVYLFIIKEDHTITLLIILASLSFLTQPFNLLQIDFLKDSDAKYVTITQLITSLITSGAKIVVVTLYASVWYFIIILITENLIAGILYIYQIIKVKNRTLILKVSLPQIKYLLYAAAPMALTLGFSDIYARIDQVMLRHYLDVSAVGLYSAAARVTELWYFIPNIIITGLFPILANSASTAENRQKKFLFLSKALFLAAIVISISVLLASKLIIGIIYGKEFLAAAPILSIYIFSLFGTFISLIILQELFIEKRTWAIILIPGGTALLNIILNIFLIPLYGASGAAFATVISYNIIPLIYYITKKIMLQL